jgi:hypothetical protein
VVKKMKLYIGLLVLGLVLIGSATWALVQSSPSPVTLPEGTYFTTDPAMIPVIPEDTPVIFEKLDFVMRGRFDRLYIYKDGSVIHTQEINLRMPGPYNPPTRIWRTGHLTDEELMRIIDLFRTGSFAAPENHYQFSGEPIGGGGFTMGDMSFTVSIVYEDMNKTVTAVGYLTPDHGETYPDMPTPLNELYVELKDITINWTTEVARERIK